MQVFRSKIGEGCRARERGTTLLEIVITVAIMTIGMLGFFTLHIRAFQMSAGAAAMTQAANVAAGLQDLLLSIPFTEGTASSEVFEECGPFPTDSVSDLCNSYGAVNVMSTENGVQGKVKFYRSYQVEWLDSKPEQIRVTVRVRYPAEDGRCPECTSSTMQKGWKAVTTSTVRAVAAY